MNCKKCGALLKAEDQFCTSCGASANEQTSSFINTGVGNLNSQPTQQTNNIGLSSQPNQPNQPNQPLNGSGLNNQSMQSQGSMGTNNLQSNGQASWQNGYTSQPMYNQMPQQKNNGNLKFIIIGVIVAVAVFAGFLIFGLINKGDNNSNSQLSGEKPSKSTYSVKFKGFTLNIPDNFIYEEDNGKLLIGDEANTWMVQLELEKGNFNQLQAKKGQLQAVLQKSGITASAAQEKTLGGVDYITFEITESGQQAIMALAKANSMYFAGITAFNLSNEFDYSLLERIAPIISTMKYNGETSNMEAGTKIDMSGFAGLAQ